MKDLNKIGKLHLIRIGLIPIFTLFLFFKFPHHYAAAAVVFCIFWLIKAYAKFLLSKEENGIIYQWIQRFKKDE